MARAPEGPSPKTETGIVWFRTGRRTDSRCPLKRFRVVRLGGWWLAVNPGWVLLFFSEGVIPKLAWDGKWSVRLWLFGLRVRLKRVPA